LTLREARLGSALGSILAGETEKKPEPFPENLPGNRDLNPLSPLNARCLETDGTFGKGLYWESQGEQAVFPKKLDKRKLTVIHDNMVSFSPAPACLLG